MDPSDQDTAEADRARARGDFGAAKALYERIWNFRAAAECALAAGERLEALRLWLEARAHPQVTTLLASLGPEPAEIAGAAALLERKRLWAQAAELRERAGELALAAELYGRAQAWGEQGRVLELGGRRREAAQAYERLFLGSPQGPAEAWQEAHGRMGRILASFGRHEEAIRHLQRALGPGSRGLEYGRAARRLLVAELARLGFREGAEHVLQSLQAEEPDAPRSLEALLDALPAQGEAQNEESLLAARYRIVRLLAASAHARVYLADDVLLGQPVALKLFAAPAGAHGREAYQRFLREARIVQALRHPNVVAVRDLDESLGLLALEFLPGGTLGERLDRGNRLSEAEVRRIATDVLAGLEAAHRHGVIHRDLKPANILFDALGTAKLADFGVAHLVDSGQTQTGGLIGTVAYMSPEQVTGARITFAADLYALGILLHEMLSGVLPFLGPDFVGQHLGAAPPPTGRGKAWDALVGRLLEKAPDARYGSIDDVRHGLSQIQAGGAEAARAGAAAPGEVSPPEPDAAEGAQSRFAPSGEPHETLASSVTPALDRRLCRGVTIERFKTPLAPHLPRLRALARAGGPHLQRILSIDEPAGQLLYEALAGPTFAQVRAEAPPHLGGALALLAALGEALAPLHAEGFAHGQVSATSIVLEEDELVLVLAGQVELARAPDPASDCAAALALFLQCGGSEAQALLPQETPKTAQDLLALAHSAP